MPRANPQSPDAVDDERLLARVRGRLPRVPEPDQEVGAEADASQNTYRRRKFPASTSMTIEKTNRFR